MVYPLISNIVRRYILVVCLLQEKLSESAASEARLEEELRRLRQSLDDVDSQLTRAEMVRRTLDADNHRLKMTVNDKETETQASLFLLI